MLVNVNVKNLALINKVDIFFDEGLNILTGETGAGKSIIIGSILIALGGKIPKDIVRDTDKEALVELVFQIDNERTIAKLREFGVETDEGNLIISRKIVNNRSTIKVNGETFTNANLKKITELLIDIHGQHDHQSLLKKSRQLEILDEFAGDTITELKADIVEKYRLYTRLNSELEEFDIDDDRREREISFCRFVIDEIENAHLKEREYEETECLFRKMSASKGILEKMNEVYSLLNGDGYESISDKIGNACRIMQNINEQDDDITNISDSLADIENICEDVKRSIKNYVDSVSFDEEQCIEVEQRVEELNKLRQKYETSKKYDDPVLNILAYQKEQEEKLDRLENIEIRKNELLKKINEIRFELEQLCGRMTDLRKQAAKDLEKKIITVLNGLNFLEVQFEVGFEKTDEFTSNGMDDVEFLISTNPGESLKPLQSVASGGELSRIMLGIKSIMAEKDDIDTLIFDEIDTGISGRTAQMVASRLKSISRAHQVICITHLPQLASMSDNHYLIEKNVIDGNTQTNIVKLDFEQSVEELSRMLGGTQITDTVRENAREMKKLANN